MIRNNGKVTGYNKIAMVQGNTITLAVPVKEDLTDKSPVPRKVLSTCEMNLEVSYRDQVELYEGCIPQSVICFLHYQGPGKIRTGGCSSR